jgi:drug/metabolite transporter (DMT)-like permease
MRQTDRILIVTLSLLWGGSFLFVEVALQGLPPVTVVFGRVSLAVLMLGLILALAGQRLPRKAWGAALVMGILNNAVPFTLFAYAQGRIDGGLAAIVNATTPLWTVAVAHVFTLDERLTAPKVLALILGLGGVVVMTGGASGEGARGEVFAILACLAAAFAYGLAGVWGRRFRAMGVAPLATAFGQLAGSTLVLLPFWLFLDRPWSLNWPGLPPLLAVLAIASLSTALAYLIYFRLLASVGATNLSLVTFLIPVSAVAMGVLFLGETVLPRHVFGFLLIVAGLLVINAKGLGWAGSKRADK